MPDSLLVNTVPRAHFPVYFTRHIVLAFAASPALFPAKNLFPTEFLWLFLLCSGPVQCVPAVFSGMMSGRTEKGAEKWYEGRTEESRLSLSLSALS